MLTETKIKVVVALTVLSIIGLIIASQSVDFHRMPKFFQENPPYSPETESYNVNREKTTGTSKALKNIAKQVSPVSSAAQMSSDEDKRPRFPKALIAGFNKCGTSALRDFLTIHPDVVSPSIEVQYFTYNFSKGLEWYRKQMPPSTPSQLTIEKTPGYISSVEALERIREFNPQIKLLVIVRDPIVRLQSQFAHAFRKTDPSKRPPFKQYWSMKPDDQRVIYFSNYAVHIREAYKLFARRQILVVNEDDMERDPLSVLKEAETFLGLRPVFTEDIFVYNKEKGFHCFNIHSDLFPRVQTLVHVNPETGCLGRDKGREHDSIGKDYLEHLKKVIRPLNEELFALLGKRFRWDNFIEDS